MQRINLCQFIASTPPIRLLVCLMLFSHWSLAQSNGQDTLTKSAVFAKKNLIKLNYLSATAGGVSIFYERVVARNLSLQLGILYNPRVFTSELPLSIFAITTEVRFYLKEDKQAPSGLFVSGYARYEKQQGTEKDLFDNLDRYRFGAMVGGQWLLGKWLSLDVWGGVGGQFIQFNESRLGAGISNTKTTELLYMVDARFGATLGVAFK